MEIMCSCREKNSFQRLNEVRPQTNPQHPQQLPRCPVLFPVVPFAKFLSCGALCKVPIQVIPIDVSQTRGKLMCPSRAKFKASKPRPPNQTVCKNHLMASTTSSWDGFKRFQPQTSGTYTTSFSKWSIKNARQTEKFAFYKNCLFF